jgi:hypothetical protein
VAQAVDCDRHAGPIVTVVIVVSRDREPFLNDFLRRLSDQELSYSDVGATELRSFLRATATTASP